MKNLFLVLFTASLLFLTATASAVQSSGWRIIFTTSIANDTPILLSEIELLYDHDDNSATANVDGTLADLGAALCGWTRQVPNLTGNTTPIPVGCDSVRTNQQPDSSITVPAGTSSIRLANRLFDDGFTTEFKTKRNIDTTNQFVVIYKFYQGSSAPSRVLPDIEQVSLTVPNDYVGPGEDGLAPSIFSIEYQGTDGTWIRALDVEAANFNDGVDVDATGATVSTDGVAKKLTVTLP